jgi:hypothetical protein
MDLVSLISWAASIFVLGVLVALGIRAIAVLPFLVGRR